MAVEIITSGGGQTLYYIFNAIAAITGGDSFMSLIKVSLGFAVVWISFKTAFALPFVDNLKWFMTYLVLYNAMLLPKETVLITDTFDSTFAATVDNVPLGIAEIGSYTSQIGSGIAKLFDQNFGLPNDLQYSNNGFLFGSKLLNDASKLKINNSELSSNMEQFITECVFYDIAFGKYTVDQLKSADDLWSFLTESNNQSQLRMFTYTTAGNRQYVTCAEGANKISAQWNSEINYQMAYLYRRNFSTVTSDVAAANYISSYIQSAGNYLMNNSKSSTDIIRQNMMINAMNDSSYSYGSSDVSGYSSLIAQSESQSNFQMLARMAEKWVPLFRIVIEAILYGIFPFLFLIFLLPSGHKVFMTYVSAFIWIQSWAPLYAILHLCMMLGTKLSISFAGGSQNLDNFATLNDINGDTAIIAGAAIMFIPLITLKLLPFAQSGLASIGNLTGAILAPASTAASAAAHETSRGNFSAGNSSYDNHNFDNVSAHKFDTAFSNQNYGGNIQNSDGSISKYTGDGIEHIDTTQMQSNFSHRMESSLSMSNALQQRAGISKSMGHNLEQESLKYEASAFDTAARMAHTYNKGKESGESWTQGIDSSTQKALENIDSIAGKIGINAGIGGGFSVKGFGGNAGINGELSKEDQDILRDSIQTINRSAQEGRFNVHDSEGKSLNEELNSNYTKYQQLSDKASSYYNESQNLSNEATRTHSLDGTVTTNEASGFYSWMTRDLGYSRGEAVSIIENPDRSQTFQKLSGDYMQHKVDDLYSRSYGKNLMDDVQVNHSEYAKQSADFNAQHTNDVQDQSHNIRSAYDNTQISNIEQNGIDNSGLMSDVKNDIGKSQHHINNDTKHHLIDSAGSKIRDLADRFEGNNKSDN